MLDVNDEVEAQLNLLASCRQRHGQDRAPPLIIGICILPHGVVLSVLQLDGTLIKPDELLQPLAPVGAAALQPQLAGCPPLPPLLWSLCTLVVACVLVDLWMGPQDAVEQGSRPDPTFLPQPRQRGRPLQRVVDAAVAVPLFYLRPRDGLIVALHEQLSRDLARLSIQL